MQSRLIVLSKSLLLSMLFLLSFLLPFLLSYNLDLLIPLLSSAPFWSSFGLEKDILHERKAYNTFQILSSKVCSTCSCDSNYAWDFILLESNKVTSLLVITELRCLSSFPTDIRPTFLLEGLGREINTSSK